MSREYKNDGRDQIPIEHLTGNVYIGDSRSRKRPDKETKWLRAFEKEIAGRLTTSLHNQILINLGKEIELDQVRRLWDMEVKSGQITEEIAPETEILEVFDRADIQGKLLILGKPGSGKTTTLLELARSLVKKALDDPSAPMPILLNLSSWKDPRQSLKDWTVAELTTKGIGSKISAKWLDDQKLLPLFDGLDEVRSDLQPACVKAINQFLSGEGKPEAIVVCSRREEYELYPQKLDLNGAIYLQELSDVQIEQYLRDVNRLALWQVLEADAELLELVRQPLLLSITLVAYREELAEQWQGLTSTQKRLDFLLDAYVEKMLHRTINSRMYSFKKEPTANQTCQWLVELAKQLQSEFQTEFLIERMQPSWLKSKVQKILYRLGIILIGGSLLGLITELIIQFFPDPATEQTIEQIGWWWSLTLKFVGHLVVGLIIGLIIELSGKEIKTFETLKWSWNEARRGFFKVLKAWLIAGLILGLAGFPFFLFYSILTFILSSSTFDIHSALVTSLIILVTPLIILVASLVIGLVFVLLFGLPFAIIFGLIRGMRGSYVEIRKVPNQGIWNSLTNTAIVWLIVGLFSGLVVGLIAGLIGEWN